MRYFQVLAQKGCPYCVNAKELLIERGEQFMFCSLDSSDDLLSYFKEKYNWGTIPMIIEKHTDNNCEKFIGGYTDLCAYLEDDDCGRA